MSSSETSDFFLVVATIETGEFLVCGCVIVFFTIDQPCSDFYLGRDDLVFPQFVGLLALFLVSVVL